MKLFWPWFKKEIWPGLRVYVLDLLVRLAADIVRKSSQSYDTRAKARESFISRKIAEAEQKAETSADRSEMEKQKAVAGVWREVAEMYRQENEELKKELEEIRKSAVQTSAGALDKTRMALENNKKSSRTLTLTINDRTHQLRLPDPAEMDEDEKKEGN